MYLNKRTYIGNKWRAKDGKLVKVTVPEDDSKSTFAIKQGQIKDERISYIDEEVMYWRKANAIHQWFIDNCTDNGEDTGQDIYVPAEKLKELLDTCKKVLKASKLIKGKVQNGTTNGNPNMVDVKLIENPAMAKKLLPTQEGFFFGSTDYNEWYYNDVKETAEAIEKLLEEEPDADYEYRASW